MFGESVTVDLTQTSVLEIAHVLFMDIVGYSLLASDVQRRSIQQLQRAIAADPAYKRFEQSENLIVLPTGDGAAMVFFRDVEAPARCALGLAAEFRALELPVRMGIHTGPVYRIADINANRNVSGGGINVAQRVMDVGDAGHILVSKAVADVLLDLSAWSNRLHPLGTTAVKHGLIVDLFNLCTEQAGNPAIPSRFSEQDSKAKQKWFSAPNLASGAAGRSSSAIERSALISSDSTHAHLTLAPGIELLHYRILEQIGGGGMGVVFAAEDMRLGRRVALKFLPANQVDAAQASERFQREARAASALNHPNICTVYEAGNIGGLEYIAMELLEGSTLKQVIADNRSTLAQRLRWAIQIADALEAASARGIVHRDLKPGNIFITSRGDVKILDFGLAKISVQDGVRTGEDVTARGVPLGTVAYMSPEQARGNRVDLRTDIFSCGLVLYELFTGAMPFPGGTSAVVFDGILNRQPRPMQEVNPDIPSALEAVVQRAIEKDPADRCQSPAEMRAELEAVYAALGSADSQLALKRLSRARKSRNWPSGSLPKTSSLRRSAMLLITAGLLLGAATTGYLWIRTRATKSGNRPVQRLPRRLTFAGAETAVQSSGISPDGKYLAYADSTGLYLRLIATGDTRRLADTTFVTALCWTPDTSRLLIDEGGAEVNSTYVSVVSTTTGARRKLIDHAFVAQGCASPDNARLTLIRTDLAQIWTIGMNGEEPAKVMDGPAGREILMITVSPDGRWLARMIDAGGKPPLIEVCNPSGGFCNRIVEDRGLIGPGGNASFAWDHHGHLLYSKSEPLPNQYNSRIWSVPIDASGRPVGEASEFLSLVGEFPADLSFTSDDRHSTYTASHLTARLRRAEIEGGKLVNERPLTGEQAYETPFAWTPDGQSILSLSSRADGSQLLRRDLSSGSSQPLAVGSLRAAAAITGDGAWALYSAGARISDDTPSRLLRVPVKGGLAEVVIDHIHPVEVSCASIPRCILAEMQGDQMVISALDPLKGRGEELLRVDAGIFGNIQISPDGQQILYGHAQRDQFLTLFDLRTRQSRTIHVQGFGNMDNLDFAPDGRSLYMCFWAPSAALVRVGLDGRAQLLRASPLGMTGFAVSPSGREIVFGETQGESNAWISDLD